MLQQCVCVCVCLQRCVCACVCVCVLETSGAAAHCVFKLRRWMSGAAQLSVSGEGGAGTRIRAAPHPPPPLLLLLSSSSSTSLPPLHLRCRRPTDTCSHFPQHEPGHVVRGGWSPAHRQRPPGGRARAGGAGGSGQDGEEEERGRERAGVREGNPVPHPDLPMEADQVSAR